MDAPFVTPQISTWQPLQSSANKVDDDEMENGVSKEEISERPLRGNALELALVLGVDLDPEANCTAENV